MDDPEFESADGWLFLAIGYAAKHRTGSLADMLGMADGIQRAVPTIQELNGAVGRLHRAGYLEEFNGQQLLPSEAGRALLDRVEAAGGTVFDKLDRLRQLIGARRWTTDYDPADAQRGEKDVINPADLARAVEAYSAALRRS